MSNEVLKEWFEISEQLKELKKREADLRKQVLFEFFENVPDDVEGTFSTPLGGGYKLKATYSLTRKINQEALKEIRPQLIDVGVNLDALVRWSPSLSVSEYRLLNQEQRELIDEVIESKPGAVKMEIVGANKNG